MLCLLKVFHLPADLQGEVAGRLEVPTEEHVLGQDHTGKGRGQGHLSTEELRIDHLQLCESGEKV